jgi:hypothetical protein
MSETAVSVVWETVQVQVSNPPAGYSAQEYFYKAWRAGHPLLAAYGANPREAVAALLNKYGERPMSDREDDGDVILLSYDEAVALLPDGDRIHTFLDAGIALIGGAWSRTRILDLLAATDRREVTGPSAQSSGHGLAAYREDGTPVFIKTRPA